ncbi:MAG: hypothetical protein WBA42_02525 [Mesorhizobium sp.]
MFRTTAVVAFILFALAAPVSANGPASVQLSKAGGVPVALTAESLSRLPTLDQEVSFQTAKGIRSARYKGVLLWEILKANGMIDESGYHNELRQVFSVTGSDGYRIDFSVGEIAPDFGNKAIMLSTEEDGKALVPPTLTVPGDKRGARNVHDVVGIEVR